MITGDRSENEKLRCLNLGANAFLNKPIRFNKLKEVLKSQLLKKTESLIVPLRNGNATIMIIDDDPFNSSIHKNYLTNYLCLQCFSKKEVIFKPNVF